MFGKALEERLVARGLKKTRITSAAEMEKRLDMLVEEIKATIDEKVPL